MKALNAGLAASWLLLSGILVWPFIYDLWSRPAGRQLQAPGGTNYLVVAPQGLMKSARAWADFRRNRGYRVELLITSVDAKAEEIREGVQRIYFESGQPYPFYLLLLGHAHPGSLYPDAFLPAPHFTVTPDRFAGYGPLPIASDDGYAADPAGIYPWKTLPIRIGRIPARGEQEALLLLERTRSYEESPPRGEGRARIELITSNAGFGAEFDPLLVWALKKIPQEIAPVQYRWHLLDGNANSPYNYPRTRFPHEVAKRFDAGALAVVYIGHGQPEMLAWVYAKDGSRGRIFHFRDAGLIQRAGSSLAIFTACSAGAYDEVGSDPGVVEAIYLTSGGPVAAYSSSAWINGLLTGTLTVDIFETLLQQQASTTGEWQERIEHRLRAVPSRLAYVTVLKEVVPRLSGQYRQTALLSRAEARMELSTQAATYNLFGDPALRIAFPESGMEISPLQLWEPMRDGVEFRGTSRLVTGENVLVSLEALPAEPIRDEVQSVLALYQQANNPVIARLAVETDKNGSFSGKIYIPPDTPSGRYLLRALAADNEHSLAAAHEVYVGTIPIRKILSSAEFWWLLTGLLFVCTQRAIRCERRITRRETASQRRLSMDSKLYQDFVKQASPAFQQIVLRIMQIIEASGEPLSCAIKWKQITYAKSGDFHHWIAGINITKNFVGLIFHFGGLLDDPKKIFIRGSSRFARKIEYRRIEEVDREVILNFLAQAMEKHASFSEHWKEIQRGN